MPAEPHTRATLAHDAVLRLPEIRRYAAARDFLRDELKGVKGWRAGLIATLACLYWHKPERYS
ncbi:MAG: hypothetical protein V3S00_01815 [Dehalococcoidia bacterium]